MQGQIISSQGQKVIVESHDKHIIQCDVRRKQGLIVCGDYVTYELTEQNNGVITERLARNSTLARPDQKQQLKPIAANFDTILIVTAPIPEPNFYSIDSYLVYAKNHNIAATIIINKQDLISNNRLSHEISSTYEPLGYPIVHTCCKEAKGLENLENHLTGKTSILVGQSGVGKSSIIQHLLPDRTIQTQKISEKTGLGKHTTTTTTLYRLQNDGNIIDSPGVREFMASHNDKVAVCKGFIEFEKFLGQCKFHNCMHINEPGCAVLKAKEDGIISQQRWQNYKKMISAIA